MKKLILTAVLLCTALQPARAISTLPFLDQLRNEVVNQQVIASNDVVANKQLLASLKKALTTIDKTKPDYVSGTKALGTLANNLNRTSVSNAFAADFDNIVNTYVGSLMNAAGNLTTALGSTFPSGPHTAALNNLDQLLAALQVADTNNSIILAAKALSLAAKKLVVTQKLVTKAQAVPAPPAQITANVSGALNTSIKTQGAAVTGVPAQFNLLGASGSASGQKTIQFSLQNVTEGTHVVNVIDGHFLITSTHPAIYTGGTGTATVTYNSATHSLYGSFTFNATGDQGSTGTVTVAGSFNGSTP